MKILISYRGIPKSPGYATGDLIANAFDDLGCDVSIYGHQYQKGWEHPISDARTVDIDELYNAEYDLLLYCEMNDPDPQYYELKRVTAAKKKAYWNFDVSYYPDVISNFVKYMNFDHVFYANYKYEDFFSPLASHISWLPYAFCPHMHQPSAPQQKTIDFSIVGSPWGSRKQIVYELQQSGIDVEFITGLHQSEYIKALARSKVTINYNQEIGAGLLVMRVFECMPNKVCLITNKGDGIHKVLKPGSECLVYENIDQLIGICEMLKEDMKMAEWCAGAAFERGYKEHTYKHRAKEILKAINYD